MPPKKDAGSSTPSPKKTARSRTPSGIRTFKSVDPVEDTSKDAPVSLVTVSGTSTGSKAADEVEEIIDEPPKKEEPALKVSVTTVTVEKKEEAKNMAILLEILDTKFFVGVVYALVVVFLFKKW
jgi:cytoskeletal protein RodZ